MPDDLHTGGIHGRRRERIEDEEVFARATSPPMLDGAWGKVLGNGGAAGGDGVTLARFLGNAPQRLARLRHALISGSYTPGPIRHVQIPKKDGDLRPLAIPTVADRVAQTAVLIALAPLVEEEFEESSFAYRLGRSVQQAVERVAVLRKAGHLYLVDADIERFFEEVPHDRLMARLGETMSDGPTTRLISLWLEHAAGSAGTPGRGLAQGSPLSPLLANLYLDRLDEAFAARGTHIVRFADDFVILAESRHGAEAALGRAERLLGEHGLALNRDKTRVTSFEQGFKFLGHLFVHSLVMAGAAEEPLGEAASLMRRLAAEDQRAAAAKAEDDEAETVRRAHGLDPGQRILYIASPDRRLAVRNTAFSVEAGSGGPASRGGHVARNPGAAAPSGGPHRARA